MPLDLRRIAEAQKKALVLIDSPEKKRTLEQFIESSGPLAEAAVRDELQLLVEDINTQLAPGARVRLVQEGSKIVPEVVSLGEEQRTGRMAGIDGDTISKVLVRMPSDVKSKAAEAAQKAGISLNSWTVNILNRAVTNLREHQERAKQSQTQDEGTESNSHAVESDKEPESPDSR